MSRPRYHLGGVSAPAPVLAPQTKPSDAAAFQSGDLLQHLAMEHVAQFQQMYKKLPGCSLKGRQTWGSLCSGSEGVHFVMAAIQCALQASRGESESPGEGTAIGQDSSQQLFFDQCFACESNPNKRDWIDKLVNMERRKEGRQLVCIFDDITKMHSHVAHCYAHERMCPIQDVTFLFVSTSCKDFSPLQHRKDNAEQPVFSQKHSTGGSADIFRGLLSYLDAHSCKVVFYEDSDNLECVPGSTASGKVGNHDIFMSELTSRFFEPQGMLLNAYMFGLPQNRRRFWSVNLTSDAISSCAFASSIVANRSWSFDTNSNLVFQATK